jgi:hypothetical protein
MEPVPGKIFPFGQPAGFGELERRFLGQFDFAEFFPVTGANVVQICPINPERVQLTICNLSAGNVIVGPKTTTSATVGILLTSNGGTISINVWEDGILPTMNWQVFDSAPPHTIYAVEVYRFRSDTPAPTP